MKNQSFRILQGWCDLPGAIIAVGIVKVSRFTRIQILTVEELLSGAAAKLPPGGTGAFKKAGKIDPAGPTQGQLDL